MKHSNEFYQELTEAMNHNKSFAEMIPIFNKNIIEEVKGRICAFCGKQIIGKGHVIHDSFGMVDYYTCNRDCADKFLEGMMD